MPEGQPGQIIYDAEDLVAVLETFDAVETIKGNKVSDQGSISVPKKYSGMRPVVALIPEGEQE